MQITSLLGYYTVLKGLGVDTKALNKGLIIFQEQGGKRFAETMKKALGLGESLADAHKATLAAAQIFGMEGETEELGKRGTVTKCPHYEIGQEFGLEKERCLAPCLAFNTAITKSFNPKFSVRRTKAIPQGDSLCEFIWEAEG